MLVGDRWRDRRESSDCSAEVSNALAGGFAWTPNPQVCPCSAWKMFVRRVELQLRLWAREKSKVMSATAAEQDS